MGGFHATDIVMLRKANLTLLVAVLAFVTGPGGADEGMWQPELLPSIEDRLRARGLALQPDALKDLTGFPMGAIVGLGFCTASFVSPNGLMVTNHHCAYGAIQYNSSEDENLLEDGFVARTFDEDKRGNPTLRVHVTESISSVTDRVRSALGANMDGSARFDAIERAKKQLVAECEQDPGYRCDVYTFYGGAEYRLIKQLDIRDVRLAYAPPGSIGRYGGEVDNWMWPRHTGDFAFFRAYVGPDGRPAEYAPDNVPFQPRHYLKLNPEGLKEDDYAMAVGYPGSTQRYALATEVDYAIAVSYPNRIASIQRWLGVIEEQTRDREDAGIKYASRVASLGNALKNYGGMLDGFARADVPGAKLAREMAVMEDRSAARALRQLRDALGEWFDVRESERRYENVRARGLLGAARQLYRLSQERQKEDLDREPGYQARDWSRIQQQLEQLERRFDPDVDRALLKAKLEEYASLPHAQRQSGLDDFFGLDGDDPDLSGLDEQLDRLYAGSKLQLAEDRMAWFEADAKAFQQSDDAFIRLAVAMAEDDRKLEKRQEARAGQIDRYRSDYMASVLALDAKSGEPTYDDANNSLRVTYGTVVGYSPRDAVTYEPFTTLEGVAEKATAEAPFDAPQSQLRAIREHRYEHYASEDLDSVPVNFLTSLDVTGGNSGSPTLDAEGRLVGLVFDGNYESINADWWFNEQLTRTIHVDIRYMLWVMDVVSDARELLRELSVLSSRS